MSRIGTEPITADRVQEILEGGDLSEIAHLGGIVPDVLWDDQIREILLEKKQAESLWYALYYWPEKRLGGEAVVRALADTGSFRHIDGVVLTSMSRYRPMLAEAVLRLCRPYEINRAIECWPRYVYGTEELLSLEIRQVLWYTWAVTKILF